MRPARPPRRPRPSAAHRLTRVSLLSAAMLLAACGFNKPDLRYRDSRLQEPLQVPADLTAPRYSASMEIPSAGAAAAAEEGAVGLEIEQPPDLRPDGPAAGRE